MSWANIASRLATSASSGSSVRFLDLRMSLQRLIAMRITQVENAFLRPSLRKRSSAA